MSAQAQHAPAPMETSAALLRADAMLWGCAALLGGATAGLRLTLPEGALVQLGLAALLVLAWQAAWSSLTEMDWRAALRSWRTWSHRRALPRLPYTLPEAPAARSIAWLEAWISWWQAWLIPHERFRLSALALGLISGVVLSVALGSYALALTLGVMLVAQLVVLTNLAQSLVLLGRGLVRLGLPFLLGFSLFNAPDLALTVMALGLSFASAGTTLSAPLWRDGGYAVMLGALLLTRQPIGAFGLGLIWLPQMLLSPLRHPHLWLLAALTVVSLTLAA